MYWLRIRFMKTAFVGLCCAQGHKLKNPKMQLVKQLKLIPAMHTMLLTGTPIQNNMLELHALLDLVAPGLLGDARSFKDEFEKKITAGTSRLGLDLLPSVLTDAP